MSTSRARASRPAYRAASASAYSSALVASATTASNPRCSAAVIAEEYARAARYVRHFSVRAEATAAALDAVDACGAGSALRCARSPAFELAEPAALDGDGDGDGDGGWAA